MATTPRSCISPARRICVTADSARIIHQEHAPILLPRGTYRVWQQREYTPHLTLARLVPPRRLDEFVPGLVGTDVSSDPFPIEELVLYRSHLSPKGVTYEPLVRAPLRARA